MQNKILYPFILSGLLLVGAGVFTVTAHAETPPETPPETSGGVVLVNDTELYSRLEVMQQTLDGIAATLAAPAEVATPETAPDYTAQLAVIADGVEQVKENTTPATPEQAASAFEKPFEEYSVSETLLLFVSVTLLALAVVHLVRR